ncbi:MAG: RNA polymerase sigma factor [Pseudomonadota bacterium]
METSDETLAQAAARGDAEAFAALMGRHYDGVFRLAFRLTGVRADAEDLTQDVCAALPVKLEGYRGDAQFRTWLWRVVVNAAHDRRRRTATHARHAEGWGDWERARRAADQDAAEVSDWLTQAMRALPPELQDTLALVLDGMSHAEAGKVLDVSEGTISWRISQAKDRLRALREREDQE